MAKKLYYKIGEACKILEIQPYVLRYWEKEFPLLSPGKSKSGQRVYSERERDIIRRIKELLYEEGYTIAGAKKKLDAELADGGAAAPEEKKAPPKPPAKRRSAPRGRASAVDTGTSEELQKLRSGVADAAAQARKILAKLESTSP